ncbi:hypothetical protein FEO92_04565 [Stenotrophomonas maltophilia]|nr:hypothetical protein [Stenotrophomonas maltophilia]MBA0321414.1 hypothetical protein [Stenotrophomonas maltophilia]QGL91687.1 hypothetical protein FEO92_04565 [Stenotrophomonas maltophilia]
MVSQVAFFLPDLWVASADTSGVGWSGAPLSQGGRGEAAGMWGPVKWGPRFAMQSVGLRRECAAASPWFAKWLFSCLFAGLRFNHAWRGSTEAAHCADLLKRC